MMEPNSGQEATEEVLVANTSNDELESSIVGTDETQSDLSDSMSETLSSEPSLKPNPAFKKPLLNNEMTPSSPRGFKKPAPTGSSESGMKKSGPMTATVIPNLVTATGEESSKVTPRNQTGNSGSTTIAKHNSSNVEQFMKSGLVQWASAALKQVYGVEDESDGNKTLRNSEVNNHSQSPTSYTDESNNNFSITFRELVDGVALNDLMYDIHPSITCKAGIQADVEEQPHLRLQNLALLLRNIRYYHAEILSEALVGRLPDVAAIARDPSSVTGLAEMKLVLQLVLGCAMKSDVNVRERHVSVIQSLGEVEQRELMQCIQEAKSQLNAISLASVEEMVHQEFQPIFNQLVDDRFELFEICNSQAVEQLSNFGASSDEGSANRNSYTNGSGLWKRGSYHSRQSSNYGEVQQLNLQVADLRMKLNKKDSDLLQKDEEIETCTMENLNLAKENKKLKDQLNESVKMTSTVRGLRDELDICKEKMARSERAEADLELAKHKLEELDYYKQRLDQSNKDYKMLEETKLSVEKHMQALECQVELLHETQRENIALQSEITSLETQLEEKEAQIESIRRENQSLSVQSKASLNESASLHQQLVNANYSQASRGRPSVGSECEDTLKFNLIQLEKEKQELKTKSTEFETQIMQLTKEKASAEKELQKFKSNANKEKANVEDLQQKIEKAWNEKNALCATIEQLQESHQSEIGCLKEEIESLTQNLESVRNTQNYNNSTETTQLKEVQEQNIVLHARIQEFMSKSNQSESEKRQVQRKLELVEQQLSENSANESKIKELNRECELLKHNLEEEKLKMENLERMEAENVRLQVELSKLRGKLDLTYSLEAQIEGLRKDGLELKAQNLKLSKMTENMNSLTQRINQLELENSEKQREIDSLQHVIQVNKSELSRAAELESRNQSLNNDIQKLRKTLEMYSEKEREKVDELSSLQLQHEAVQRELETLKLNNESLESKLKEYQTLDSENCTLVKEKRQLEIKIDRFKRDLEEYDTKEQDYRSKISVMERELKRSQRFTERDLGKDEQIQEFKNENSELRKQSMVDKKTINNLREELVNEKLHHQAVATELEKTKSELVDRQTEWKLEQHQKLLNSTKSGSNSSSPSSSFITAAANATKGANANLAPSVVADSVVNSSSSPSLIEVKDKRIKELETILTQKSTEKDAIQQELEILKNQLPKSPSYKTNTGIGGLGIAGLDDFNALDKEHRRARERIENLTQELDVRQNEMNDLVSAKYRHEGQIDAYRKQLQRTHTETANIQVELSTMRSENASLKSQVTNEQSRITRIQHELSVRNKELEEIQSSHDQLQQGHEMLQALHSNLSRDYEDRMSQLTQLRNDHKKLSNNHRELQDKYEVLKSEKEVLEKQNSSLKGQRDALVNTNSDSLTGADSTIIELEQKLQTLKESNNNLKLTNATLMEAFEKLKKDRDAGDLRKSEVRQLQSEKSELKSKLANLHSRNEHLEILNVQMKNEFDLLKDNNEQLCQMFKDYDSLHEQLKSRQSPMHSSRAVNPDSVHSEIMPLSTSSLKGSLYGRPITEDNDFAAQVRTPSLEHIEEEAVKIKQKFVDLRHQQEKLYENSAFVTATLPRSLATDSPSLQRKLASLRRKKLSCFGALKKTL